MTLGVANPTSVSQLPYLEILVKGWVFMLSKGFLWQTVTSDIKDIGGDSYKTAEQSILFFPTWKESCGGGGQDATYLLQFFCHFSVEQITQSGKLHSQHSPGGACDHFCLHSCSPLLFVLSGHGWRVLSLASLCVDPVSRKNVKSAHSTRNRYSSQWTLTKCQASTPARTLTSDWRTVGSQHGVTVTESDSYSASLSQDTGVLETCLYPIRPAPGPLVDGSPRFLPVPF